MTSVALPALPAEMRLPFKSAMVLMPVASVVTTCMRLGYSTNKVFTSTLRPLNFSWPLAASKAASTMEKAT